MFLSHKFSSFTVICNIYTYTYFLTLKIALLKWTVTNLSGSLNIVKHAISVVLFPSSSMYTSLFFRCPLSFFCYYSCSILLNRSRDVVLLIYVSGLLPVCGKNVRGREGRVAQGRPRRIGGEKGRERKSGVRVAADSAWTVQG